MTVSDEVRGRTFRLALRLEEFDQRRGDQTGARTVPRRAANRPFIQWITARRTFRSLRAGRTVSRPPGAPRPTSAAYDQGRHPVGLDAPRHAGVAQWQSPSLPSWPCGFDSRRPLQGRLHARLGASRGSDPPPSCRHRAGRLMPLLARPTAWESAGLPRRDPRRSNPYVPFYIEGVGALLGVSDRVAEAVGGLLTVGGRGRGGHGRRGGGPVVGAAGRGGGPSWPARSWEAARSWAAARSWEAARRGGGAVVGARLSRCPPVSGRSGRRLRRQGRMSRWAHRWTTWPYPVREERPHRRRARPPLGRNRRPKPGPRRCDRERRRQDSQAPPPSGPAVTAASPEPPVAETDESCWVASGPRRSRAPAAVRRTPDNRRRDTAGHSLILTVRRGRGLAPGRRPVGQTSLGWYRRWPRAKSRRPPRPRGPRPPPLELLGAEAGRFPTGPGGQPYGHRPADADSPWPTLPPRRPGRHCALCRRHGALRRGRDASAATGTKRTGAAAPTSRHGLPAAGRGTGSRRACPMRRRARSASARGFA